MTITIETNSDQDEALERSRAGSALSSSLTLEQFATNECTNRLNEHVSAWRDIDTATVVQAIKDGTLDLSDLKTQVAASKQTTPPIKTLP